MLDHSACCLKKLKEIVLHEKLPFDYRCVIENLRNEGPQNNMTRLTIF